MVEKAPSTRLSGAVYHTVQLYEQTGGDLTNIALRLPAERPVTAAKSITVGEGGKGGEGERDGGPLRWSLNIH